MTELLWMSPLGLYIPGWRKLRMEGKSVDELRPVLVEDCPAWGIDVDDAVAALDADYAAWSSKECP